MPHLAPRPQDLGLVAVVQQLSLSRDIGSILEVLRSAARALTGADGVTVILREGDQCHYADEDAIAPLWKGSRFPLKSCVSGLCMLERQQLAIADIYADPRIPHDLYRATFVKSLAVTPIRATDPLGAIGAYWANRHEATAEELQTLQALGDSAAVAFENVRLIESLTEASRRKDEFLFMLAHELRNPLAPISNALHVMRRGDLDPRDADRARAMMERQVRHLARITDDLLDTARIAKGKIALRPERVELGEVVRQSVQDHRAQVEDAGLAIDLEPARRPLPVRADTMRIAQVLGNLIGNAVKFTPAPGRIHVSVGEDGGQATVRVRDTGMGIEPEFLPRIFESFSQADKSLERTRGGLGIGLTLARSLAQAHDGSLEARSGGAGRGAEFLLRLPLEDESAALEPSPAKHAIPQVRRLRVLVVEDNLDAAESLRMLLEMNGHDVALRHTGPEGVEAATEQLPDVVLCDIGLPGLDGYGVASRLRSDPRTAGTRLIAVTGYGAAEDRSRALSSGFDEHLVKPVAPEALLERLAAHT